MEQVKRTSIQRKRLAILIIVVATTTTLTQTSLCRVDSSDIQVENSLVRVTAGQSSNGAVFMILTDLSGYGDMRTTVASQVSKLLLSYVLSR